MPAIRLRLLPTLFVAKMLVLYETSMGYCLFKLSDAAKLEEADLYKDFETPERANTMWVAISIMYS